MTTGFEHIRRRSCNERILPMSSTCWLLNTMITLYHLHLWITINITTLTLQAIFILNIFAYPPKHKRAGKNKARASVSLFGVDHFPWIQVKRQAGFRRFLNQISFSSSSSLSNLTPSIYQACYICFLVFTVDARSFFCMETTSSIRPTYYTPPLFFLSSLCLLLEKVVRQR